MHLGDLAGAEADLLRVQGIQVRNGNPRRIANVQALLARLALLRGDAGLAQSMADAAYQERVARLPMNDPNLLETELLQIEVLLAQVEHQEAARRLQSLMPRIQDDRKMLAVPSGTGERKHILRAEILHQVANRPGDKRICAFGQYTGLLDNFAHPVRQ